MRVTVDMHSGVAPWRQVHDQVRRLIDGGELGTGARLPPIRQLARDLGLASGTVARVYRELENAGVVTTARGGGTVVAECGVPAEPGGVLRGAATEFAAYARGLGIGEEDAVRAVRVAFAEPDR